MNTGWRKLLAAATLAAAMATAPAASAADPPMPTTAVTVYVGMPIGKSTGAKDVNAMHAKMEKDGWRFADDGDLIGDLADLQCEVDDSFASDRQADAAAHGGGEPLKRSGDLVRARLKIGSGVAAPGIGHERAAPRRVRVRDGDGGAGQHGSGVVLHRAGNRAARGLCLQHTSDDGGEERSGHEPHAKPHRDTS